MWEPQLRGLSPKYRLIAYDMRGLGESKSGDGQTTMETMLDDLIGLLDALGLDSAVLCGLSMGGYLALRAAEREPRRVSGLVLADTRSSADDNAGRLARAGSIALIKRQGLGAFTDAFLPKLFSPKTLLEGRECVAAARQVVLRSDPAGVCGAILAMLSRTDTTDSLRRLRVPVLVLAGEHDSITPPEACRAMAAAIPGARSAVIPDAGHMSSLENPEAFNAELSGFLDRIRA
jgi:3-oxoadipate enol-lactonase